ncbi:hypothetical protein DFQ27_001912 [Actinomortierella ambigua]|uniref:Uncharacterized protein n=1 Tax=Actinomortierella ambigua TaxID=1343610 RepID=A0A9P6U7Z8_9FUNG|nr:hypothetical protein DFQ27_001912 [Actinomortierella ambigua]
MNFFRNKKKQDDQAQPPPSTAAPPASSSGTRPRAVQSTSSATGIQIPPRTKSNQPTSSTNSAIYPNHINSSQPGSTGNSSPQSTHNSHNPNLSHSFEQLTLDPQQQQLYQQQQYQQQQQPYQPYSQPPPRDSDTASVNSTAMLAPPSMQQQPPYQQGSYGDNLMSNPMMQNHYANDAQRPGGMAEDYDSSQQQQQQQQQQQDQYYGQSSGVSYDQNGTPILASGPVHLAPPGQQPPGNGHLNGGGDLGSQNGVTKNSNGSGESLALTPDVRKLQDEIQSWKKSQESSQAKVNQLRTTLTQKSQEFRDLNAMYNQVVQDRLALQEQVNKREKEMDDLRSKYLNDVRQIRATDDDHSTIEQKIRILQAAILQLTKSSSGDRAVNLKMEAAQALVKKKYKFGNTQPYILNMFLEKYIMDSLLEDIFQKPTYVGFELGDQFDQIHSWMTNNNFGEQAVRFRQQVCFMSAKAPIAQAHAQSEAKRIAGEIEKKLEMLYNNWTGQQKVLDLVTKAIDLSLTMRSQNAEIKATPIPADTDFDAEKMVPAHKSRDGGKVKVCVFPCFVDSNGVVVGRAKVFCS